MKHVETGARGPIVILVTGFGAFPGAPRNPSAAIVARLARQRARLARLGVRLDTRLLPVVFDRVGTALRAAVAERTPDALLHLGLAGRRRGLSIETRALNRAGPLHPDAARRRTAQTIVRGGAPALQATYPARRIAAAIARAGVEARLSNDAGDYVCNTTLYLTLKDGLAPQAGFLHVPRTQNPGQPRHRTRRRRPSLDDLTRAVLAAILTMTGQARLDRATAASRPSRHPTDAGSEHR